MIQEVLNSNTLKLLKILYGKIMNLSSFDSFIDHFDCGIVVVDKNATILYNNGWFYDNCEHQVPLVNTSILGLVASTHQQNFLLLLGQTLQSKKSLYLDIHIFCDLFEFRKKNNNSLKQQIILIPSPNCEQVLIKITDVSEYQELNTKLEIALKQQQHLNFLVSYDTQLLDENILMLKTTKDGIVTSTSKAFLQLTNTKEDDLIGYKQFFLTQTEWDELDINPKYSCTISYKIKQKTFYAEVSLIPMYDQDDDSILEYTILLHDLTDKKMIDHLKSIDLLTNLTNRIKFHEMCEYEFHQSKRYKSPMSMIAIQIDNFFKINEKYGVEIGNTILVEFAQMLKANLRKTDTIARWNGTIFIVLLTKTDLNGAKLTSEILKNVIDQSLFAKTNITCSIGTTSLNENMTLTDFYIKTEFAQKQAKQSGGNQIIAI